MKVNITLLTMITCAGPRSRWANEPGEFGGSAEDDDCEVLIYRVFETGRDRLLAGKRDVGWITKV
jgi:hypothetical protein